MLSRVQLKRHATRACLSLFLPAAHELLQAEETTVVLTPSKDNSLYESPTGSLSNGAGDFLFIGRTNHQIGSPDNPSDRQGLFRRAVIQFALAGSLPQGVEVTGAALELYVSNVSFNVAPDDLETTAVLHRLTKDWGEGTSDAIQQEGLGAPSETGDATWIHTSFETGQWENPGGDFDPAPSATTTVGDKFLWVRWESARMLDEVRQWIEDPASNHGWIVIGDESSPLTAKRFNSRSNPNEDTRPRLVLTIAANAPEGEPFAITSVSLGTGGQLVIRFPTLPSRLYTVEENEAPAASPSHPWLPLEPGVSVEGTGQPVTIEVPGQSGSSRQRFVRVVESELPAP